MTGKLLGGRYRILQLLGSSEMGSTYLAHDELLGADVALKIITSRRIKEREYFTAFYNTFRLCVDLEHPDIVRALDSGLTSCRLRKKGSVEEQVPFLVFEYFPGQPVSKVLRARSLSIEAKLGYFCRILEIVEYMHSKGFVHHAIKSNNILINEKDEIKIGHFGISPQAPEPVATRKEWAIQKEASLYKSPELAGGGTGDEKSDLYSLGILLYEILTGKLPFNGTLPEEIVFSQMHNPPPPLRMFNPSIPPLLEQVVLTLLQKNSSDRIFSIPDLKKMLMKPELSSVPPDSGAMQDEKTVLSTVPVVPPLVRRKKLEKYIKDFIRAAETDSHTILVVSGAPGVGKKRLMEQMGSYSRLLGVDYIRGRCLKDACSPYEPFISVVREFLARRKTTVSETIKPPYSRVLSTLLGERGFRSIETEDPNRPFILEHQVLESFRLFFNRIGRDTLILMVLEDFQWCGDSALTLLEYLVTHRQGEKIAIFITCPDTALSPESPFGTFREKMQKLGYMKELKIPPLSGPECTCLLRNLTGAEKVSEEFSRAVYDKSRGNPLYILESMRHLIPDGMVFSVKNEIFGNLDSLARLPDDLFEIVIRRVVVLPETLKELYKTAATIGKMFTFNALQEAMGKVQDEVLTSLLEKGKRLGFHEKTGAGDTFMFYHNTYRDAFYDLISQNEKKERHATIGAILEEIYFGNLVEHFEELAMHFNRAYDDDRTIRYMIKVADKSALAGAYRRAITFYEEALSLIGGRVDKSQERWKCYRNLGVINLRLKNIPMALEYQMKALDLSGTRNDRAAVLECYFLIADIHMGTGDNKKASEIIETALGYETMRDNVWKCKLLSRRGRLAMYNNYKEMGFEDAVLSLKESFSIAQDLRNVDAAMETSEILAEIYSDQNMEEEGERALSKILRYRTGPEMRLRILEKLGSFFLFPGSDNKRALKYFREGLDISSRVKDKESLALFSSHLGAVYSRMGEMEEAAGHLEKALAIQKAGSCKGLTRTCLYLADFHFLKGDFARSRQSIEEARESMKEAPDPGIDAELNIRLGHGELMENNPEAAAKCFQKAYDTAESSAFFKGIFFSLLGSAEISLREGNLEAARTFFVDASRRNRKGKNWFGNARLTFLQGIGFRIDENYELALNLLSRAQDVFTRIERPYEMGLVNLEKGRTLRLSGGEEAQVKECFNQARECFSKMGNEFMISTVMREQDNYSLL